VNGQVGEVTKCPSNYCPLYIYRKGGLDKDTKTPSFEKFDRRDALLQQGQGTGA
jgi:hypothetical protein